MNKLYNFVHPNSTKYAKGNCEMKKKKKTEYDYLAHAASATDCTGLLPTPTTSEAEREAYEALYPFMAANLDETEKEEGS